MALQLIFARRVLYKSCNGEGSERVKLVRKGLKVSIVNMFYIEVWSGVLIFAAFISVLTMFVCLVRACFSIFFYIFIVSKVKCGITLRYIVIYKEILKRSTSGRKLLSKLLFPSALCKQC